MKKTIAILCAMMLAMCAFIPALADDLGKEVAAGAVNGVITGATVSIYRYTCPICGAPAKKTFSEWDQDNVRLPGGGYAVQESRYETTECIHGHTHREFVSHFV